METIGIFDSGIGGLYPAFDLIKRCPGYEYVYVADQKNLPYGNKTTEQLESYFDQIVQFFIDQEIYHIVVACNTMCASVLDKKRKQYPNITFYSIIDAVLKNIEVAKFKKPLVLATVATIDTNLYQKFLDNQGYYHKCPNLANDIESRKDVTSWIENELVCYKGKIDGIILGCTHYSKIKDQLQKFLEVDCIDGTNQITFPETFVDGSLFVATTKDASYLQNQIKLLFNFDVQVVSLFSDDQGKYYFK